MTLNSFRSTFSITFTAFVSVVEKFRQNGLLSSPQNNSRRYFRLFNDRLQRLPFLMCRRAERERENGREPHTKREQLASLYFYAV